jgi:hypothetical protein
VCDIGGRRHLATKHKHEDFDRTSPEILAFLQPTRDYDASRKRKGEKRKHESDTESDAAAPAPSEDSSESATSEPKRLKTVRDAMQQLPVARGTWVAEYKAFLAGQTPEYVTYAQRWLGFVRSKRGMPLKLDEEKDDLDSQVGGLLDLTFLKEFRSHVETTIRPPPSPPALRKHLEAYSSLATWRKHAWCHDLDTMSRMEQLYKTVETFLRDVFASLRREERKHIHRKNLVHNRISEGKYKDAETIRSALQAHLDTWWCTAFQAGPVRCVLSAASLLCGVCRRVVLLTWTVYTVRCVVSCC